MSLVHVHAPKPTAIKVRVLRCPTCEAWRKMLCRDYEWYGPLVVCLTCGETWSGGEMCPRPFARGWRKENVRRAREALAKAKP